MQATTNMTPIDQIAAAGRPVSRAERRRMVKAATKQFDYSRSGFVDSAVYAPSAPVERHKPFTPEQLHARAVERQIIRTHRNKAAHAILSQHEMGRLFDDRAPHANRSTAEHRHYERRPARERAREMFEAGVANNLAGKSADGRRSLCHRDFLRREPQQEAPLAMAA